MKSLNKTFTVFSIIIMTTFTLFFPRTKTLLVIIMIVRKFTIMYL